MKGNMMEFCPNCEKALRKNKRTKKVVCLNCSYSKPIESLSDGKRMTKHRNNHKNRLKKDLLREQEKILAGNGNKDVFLRYRKGGPKGFWEDG